MNNRAAPIKEIQETFELSLLDAKRVVDLVSEDPRFAENIALAAAYVNSESLAIKISGDPEARERWNYRHALSTIDRFR